MRLKKVVLPIIFFILLFSACSKNSDSNPESSNQEAKETKKKDEILYGVKDVSLYKSDVTYDDLARTPDKYSETYLILEGTIHQVIETDDETQYILLIDNNPENIMFAHFIKNNPNYPKERLLEGDSVKFKAGSLGLTDYETVASGIKTVPNISIHKII